MTYFDHKLTVHPGVMAEAQQHLLLLEDKDVQHGPKQAIHEVDPQLTASHGWAIRVRRRVTFLSESRISQIKVEVRSLPTDLLA